MSALADIYIKEEVLDTILTTIRKKGQKGVTLTISINDSTNDYGQNLSAFVSQTKEQREAKASKYYVGNGKVLWTDGKIVVAERKDQPQVSGPNASMQGPSGTAQSVVDDDSDDLPF